MFADADIIFFRKIVAMTNAVLFEYKACLTLSAWEPTLDVIRLRLYTNIFRRCKCYLYVGVAYVL